MKKLLFACSTVVSLLRGMESSPQAAIDYSIFDDRKTMFTNQLKDPIALIENNFVENMLANSREGRNYLLEQRTHAIVANSMINGRSDTAQGVISYKDLTIWIKDKYLCNQNLFYDGNALSGALQTLAYSIAEKERIITQFKEFEKYDHLKKDLERIRICDLDLLTLVVRKDGNVLNLNDTIKKDLIEILTPTHTTWPQDNNNNSGFVEVFLALGYLKKHGALSGRHLENKN